MRPVSMISSEEGIGNARHHLPTVSSLRSARDLTRLDRYRIELLRNRDIANASVDRLHGRAGDLLASAELAENPAHAEAEAASAYLTERSVYKDTRQDLQGPGQCRSHTSYTDHTICLYAGKASRRRHQYLSPGHGIRGLLFPYLHRTFLHPPRLFHIRNSTRDFPGVCYRAPGITGDPYRHAEVSRSNSKLCRVSLLPFILPTFLV